MDKKTGYQVHPFPTWSDYVTAGKTKTWRVESSVPLSGVFFLEQSQIDEVVPIGKGEASLLMADSGFHVCVKGWGSVGRRRRLELTREIHTSASELARAVPAFRLRASLHGEFWRGVEKALGW